MGACVVPEPCAPLRVARLDLSILRPGRRGNNCQGELKLTVTTSVEVFARTSAEPTSASAPTARMDEARIVELTRRLFGETEVERTKVEGTNVYDMTGRSQRDLEDREALVLPERS